MISLIRLLIHAQLFVRCHSRFVPRDNYATQASGTFDADHQEREKWWQPLDSHLLGAWSENHWFGSAISTVDRYASNGPTAILIINFFFNPTSCGPMCCQFDINHHQNVWLNSRTTMSRLPKWVTKRIRHVTVTEGWTTVMWLSILTLSQT